jgi:DNA-binding CsgD family transcriptional regulator
VLAGPPGVGKSRLAAELAARATAAGDRTRTITATTATRLLPLGALTQALSPPESTLDASAALWSAIEGLRAEAAEGRVLFVVDDAHLLDDLSATVLHRLAADRALTVVATMRTSEPVPAPIAALWTEDIADRLEVGPLTRADVDELASSVLGGAVAPATREELWRLSQGNVLFLHEIVVGAVDAGTLTRAAGTWEHQGPLARSSRLEDAIAARLDALGSEVQPALEIVAIGGRLGYRVMEKLVDAALIAQLEDAGFLAVVQDGRRAYVRSPHPLYTEVVRNRMGRARTHAVVAMLVEALEASGGRRREDALQMGAWLLDAAAPANAAILTRASAEADRRGDPVLAERLARAALDAGAGEEARLILGESLRGQGRNEEAEPILADLARHALDDDVRVRAVRWFAKLRFFDPQRFDEGLAALARAREDVQPPHDRLLTAEHGMMLLHLGRFTEALAVASTITEAEPVDDTALVLALTAAAGARVWLGQPGRANRDALRGLALAERVAPEFEYSLLASSLFSNWLLGRHPSPSPVLHHEVGTDVEASRPGTGPHVSATLVFEGRIADSVPVLDVIIDLIRASNPEGSLAVFLGYRAEAAALLGDTATARALVDEARAVRGPYHCYDYSIERADVWTRVADGRVAEAVDYTIAVADAHVTEPGYEALALHDAVRLGAADRVVDRLHATAARAPEPGRIATFAAQATAVTAGDGDALVEIVDAYEVAGTMLWAAEAAAQAATAFERAGNGVRALELRRRADALVDRCGGVRTPGLVTRLPQLTDREHEVATLAARGLSNPQIAERLFVSARTVENHLAHVYDKLGVRGREHLAAALDALGNSPLGEARGSK